MGAARFLPLLSLAVLASLSAAGQGRVEGRVTEADSATVVGALVVVANAKDSSVVKQTVSDLDGNYSFANLVRGSYIIRATSFARHSKWKRVMVWDGAAVRLDLPIEERVELGEVKVVSTGISVRGDTTTYVVERFTSGAEQNLGDVLDRLPGVSVDRDKKTITANGKQVSRILLEDQDLFQGNMAIPLENMGAQGLKRIDVIDNYSEFDIFNGFRTSNETVLNVGVDDKTKNKVHGRAEGGGGLFCRYSVKNSSLYIGRKSMLSLIAASNNVGDRLLTFQDIMQFSGGLGTMLADDDPMARISRLMSRYASFVGNRTDVRRLRSGMVSLHGMANVSPHLKLQVGGVYGNESSASANGSEIRYTSGEEFAESNTESNKQNSALFNLKAQYSPSGNFSTVFSGDATTAFREKSAANIVGGDTLTHTSKPTATTLSGNLLVAKRFGENVLSLTATASYNTTYEPSVFAASYNYFPADMGLNSNYEYDRERGDATHSAQLLYLHRLSETYFMRLGVGGELRFQRFKTRLSQDAHTARYDNDVRMDSRRWDAHAEAGRDRGDITFSVRLRYAALGSSTNLVRPLSTPDLHLFAPRLRLRCAFSPLHFLSAEYDVEADVSTASDIAPGSWLKTYKQVQASSADRIFSTSQRVALTHMLSAPFAGVNVMTMASFASTANGLTDSNGLNSHILVSERVDGKTERRLSLTTMTEYKVINIPLNVRANVSYTLVHRPVYNFGALYDTKSGTVMTMLQLVTFYKGSFNGDVKWQMARNVVKDRPSETDMTTNDFFGMLSWHNELVYASVNSQLNFHTMSGARTANHFAHGFEVRIEMLKSLTLKVIGRDIWHLRRREQTTGTLNSYATANSRTQYMPGNIMAGLVFKY